MKRGIDKNKLIFISTSAVDCLEIPIPEMTYCLSSGTLNSNHSLVRMTTMLIKFQQFIVVDKTKTITIIKIKQVTKTTDDSHKSGSRLPLIRTTPTVTFLATEHHCPFASTKLYCFCEQLSQSC